MQNSRARANDLCRPGHPANDRHGAQIGQHQRVRIIAHLLLNFARLHQAEVMGCIIPLSYDALE